MALTDNIIGCWSPSIRGGGGILPDLSGYANHALPVGLSGTMWTGSQVGIVMSLPASNYQLNCGTMGNESFLNGFTFVSWCYNITTPNFDGALIGKDGAVISYVNAGKVIAFWGGTGRVTSVATVTSLSRWQCVVTMWDKTTARIFIDGRQDNSAGVVTAPSAATNTMRIGNYGPSVGGRYVTGLIGETVVYNRGISGPEVYEIFRRGNGAIGRMLTGQPRRRTYGFVTGGFKAYWARRQNQIIGGGV